ncbi:MAG: response regulator transcription factor, partial [Bacteroidota bacterium]
MQTSQNHIHILLIDDHKMMRSGLSSLLEKETDFSIIGAAESEEQAVKILEKQDADVALINLSRQDSATSNCVRVVRDFFPEMAILVITDRNQKDYFRTMIRAGANGIVFSQSDPDSLRL